jgi:hypothetical protein
VHDTLIGMTGRPSIGKVAGWVGKLEGLGRGAA